MGTWKKLAYEDDVILKSLLTERGSIIYRNATVPAELLHGTSGQVLRSGGHGADPSWATPTIGAVVSSGSYTGDGNNNRAIAHGLGKTPSIVFLQAADFAYAWEIIPTLAKLNYWTATTQGQTGGMSAMDATNFYVGNSAPNANANGTIYYWVAIG